MRRTFRVSDVTGEELTRPAIVKLTIGNKVWIMEVNDDESIVEYLQTRASLIEDKRGRKKKAAVAA